MKIDFIGYTGKTGAVIYDYLKNIYNLNKLVNSKNSTEYNCVDSDIIIDFSSKDFLLSFIVKNVSVKLKKVFYILGTTGFSEEDFENVDKAFKRLSIIGLHFPNFSLGMNLLNYFVKIVSLYFDDVEIIEAHHKTKKDKPSGTSLMTSQLINQIFKSKGLEKQINIHSLRLPSIVAHQSVIFSNEVGEVLEITHHSLSRSSFSLGVKKVIDKIINNKDSINLSFGLHKNINILEFLEL